MLRKQTVAYCRDIRLLLYYRKFNRTTLLYGFLWHSPALWFPLGILTFLQNESDGLRQQFVFVVIYLLFFPDKLSNFILSRPLSQGVILNIMINRLKFTLFSFLCALKKTMSSFLACKYLIVQKALCPTSGVGYMGTEGRNGWFPTTQIQIKMSWFPVGLTVLYLGSALFSKATGVLPKRPLFSLCVISIFQFHTKHMQNNRQPPVQWCKLAGKKILK